MTKVIYIDNYTYPNARDEFGEPFAEGWYVVLGEDLTGPYETEEQAETA